MKFLISGMLFLGAVSVNAASPVYTCSVGFTDHVSNRTTWGQPSRNVTYGGTILTALPGLENRTYGLQLSESGTAMIMVDDSNAKSAPYMIAIGSKNFVGLVDNTSVPAGQDGVSIRCNLKK